MNKDEYTFSQTQESNARSDEERLANEGAQREFAALQQGGKFQTVADIATWGRGQDLNTPQGRAAYKMAQSQAPDAFKLMDPVTPLPGAAGAPAASLVGIGGIDTNKLFDSLLLTESNGQQFKADGSVVTSPKGATGIAQVMPATGPEAAKLAGLPWDEARFKGDVEYNKALGRAYFTQQLKTFEDPAKALAAYNAGPGATRDAIAKAEKAGNPASWLSFLPKETQDYVPKTLGRVGRSEATARADQAGVAVLDKANQQGIPQNRRIVQALQAGLDGKTDTSLRGTIGRHTTQGGMFAGVDSDQVEKLLQEIDQKIGGGGNFEVAAAILADQSTETLGKWRDWVPGIRGSGKHFDADTVKKAVDQFKANGGMQLYTRQAADSAVRAAMDSQQQNTAAVETLTKQVQDAQRLAASGNPTAVQQLPLLEQQLQAARQTAVQDSGEAFTQYGPTPNPRRATASTVTGAPITAPETASTPTPTAPAGYDEFIRNFGKPKARPEVVPAQEAAAPEAPEAPEAPPRRVVSWPEPMTPARISTMTAAEAAAVLRDPQKVRRLPPNVKLMLEARAGA